MADLERKLALLDYPRLSSFKISDASEVVMLVAFLEDRYVRILDVDKRTPLRKGGEVWHTAFADYLVQAGCPYISTAYPYDRVHTKEYVRWLIGNAISLSYEDNAETINKKAKEALAAHSAAASSSSSSFSSSSCGSSPMELVEVPESASPPAPSAPAAPVVKVSPEAAKLIAELAALLQVSADERDALHTLQAVHRAIRQRVMPALAAAGIAIDGSGSGGSSSSSSASAGAGAASSAAAKPKGGSLAGKTRRTGPVLPESASSSSSGAAFAAASSAEASDLEAFPAGVATGSSLLDKATAVLRMLYLTDLRELQDSVNDILVTVQEYTANPKTDSSLGAVGR